MTYMLLIELLLTEPLYFKSLFLETTSMKSTCKRTLHFTIES